MNSNRIMSDEAFQELRRQQRKNWSAEQPQLVEELLNTQDSQPNDDQLLELIYAEVCLRKMNREIVDALEYRTRFPQIIDPIDRMFELHQAIVPEDTQVIASDFERVTHSQPDVTHDLDATLPILDPENGTLQPSLMTKPNSAAAATRVFPVCGRYRIIRELGAGAYGTVYLAKDTELPREVAIKLLHKRHLNSPKILERFREEARRLATLDHPRIVPIYDVGRTDNREWFLVSKYLPQGSLEALLKTERLKPELAAELIAGLADGLHQAHQRGIVHRDVKPANVLLDEEGNPLLTDFGLALDEDQQSAHRGEVTGTPAYMAPEQTEGQSHHMDGRTDIWALGVMLYEMLCGRRPFVSTKTKELFDEIQQRNPKPPRMIDDAVPEELERIALRCLAKPISNRYSTAGDLAKDLRSWRQSSTSQSATQVNSDGVTSKGTQKSLREPTHLSNSVGWVSVVGAIALVLIGASATYLAWSYSVPNPIVIGDNDAGDPLPPLTETIDILLWDEKDTSRQNLWLGAEGALPLREDDNVRVEAKLDSPAYIYIVWINGKGEAMPVYPWRPGDWNDHPTTEQPTRRVSLPEAVDEGWPMGGDAGMETLVMFTRSTPLNHDEVNLQQLLTNLPEQPLTNPGALVWFNDGNIVTEEVDPSREPKFFDKRKVNDPVRQAQQKIRERLKLHFESIQAVSFANAGAQ